MQDWLEEAACANALWKKEQNKGIVKTPPPFNVNFCFEYFHGVIRGEAKSTGILKRTYLKYDPHIFLH